MNKKVLLPIGSVVKLKNNHEYVMIIKEEPNPGSEYIGVDHKNGYASEKELKKFSIDDIEEVYFLGYQNKTISERIKKNNEIINKGNK